MPFSKEYKALTKNLHQFKNMVHEGYTKFSKTNCIRETY